VIVLLIMPIAQHAICFAVGIPAVECYLHVVGKYNTQVLLGVPRWQPHRRSGLATLPSVGAVP